MLLDTGSEVNLICSRLAESLKLNPRPVRNISVQGITEHDLDCQGYLELPIRLGKSVVNLPFFAINNLPYDSLISVQFLQHIGARLDFSRNVMDYWQNGIYSGPVKLRTEQKLNPSALDNVRARSIQLVRMMRCYSAKMKAKSDFVEERVARCVSVEQSVDVLKCRLINKGRRLNVHITKNINLEPGTSIKISLPLHFSTLNPVHKNYTNSCVKADIRVACSTKQQSYLLCITNMSSETMSLEKDIWLCTISFVQAASLIPIKEEEAEQKTIPVYSLKANCRLSNINTETENKPVLKPDMETYCYSTYPQALADGFNHNEIGEIKRRLREKSFRISDFNFSTDLTKDEIRDAKKILCEHKSVFTSNNQWLHTTDMYEASFEMLDDVPVFTPPYRTSPEHLCTMRTHIQDQLNAGHVQPASSPYNSAVILVAKKIDSTYTDTNYKLIEQPTSYSERMPKNFKRPMMVDVKNTRMCIDYRRTNSRTKKYTSNIGDVEAAIAKAAKHKYAITLDISSAFNCIPLAKDCREKLAFSLPNDPTQWQPTTLPFGHSLSPILFAKALMKILGPDLVHSDFLSVFVDDLLITADSFEEALFYLELVLAKLELANLCIRPSKCQFSKLKFRALGKLIDEDGIKLEKSKLDVIAKIQPPTNRKGLQAINGLFNYHRTFVKDYSTIMHPLFQLLKAKRFRWNKECQRALDQMKDYLLKEPCLAPFRPDFDNILHTDASHTGLGVVFLQRNPETLEEKPVYYLSWTLSVSELNYGITELEASAILYGVTVLKHYLIGKPFEVVTDHQPLVELHRINQGNTRLTRIALKLSHYQMSIKYKPGKCHVLPDFASRYPHEKSAAAKERDIEYIKKANDLPGWDSQGRIPLVSNNISVKVSQPHYVNIFRLEHGIRSLFTSKVENSPNFSVNRVKTRQMTQQEKGHTENNNLSVIEEIDEGIIPSTLTPSMPDFWSVPSTTSSTGKDNIVTPSVPSYADAVVGKTRTNPPDFATIAPVNDDNKSSVDKNATQGSSITTSNPPVA